MAQQQAIKLKIAGKSYSFTLKHEANEEQSLAEKEELYRLAEREVNAYVTRFEKPNTKDSRHRTAWRWPHCSWRFRAFRWPAAEKWAAKISAGWKRCATRSTNT